MPNTVKIGAKLKKTDAPDYILEVIELITPRGEFPHARTRIRTARFDLGTRLYSVSALEDTKLFLPVTDVANHVVVH